MKISGYVCASNALKLDYMLAEAARSLIPVCDEVVLSIGPSTDGTRELAEQLCKEDDRFRILDYPNEMPVREITWWTTWINWTRRQLKFPLQLEMDADEVLCPGSYEAILEIAKNAKVIDIPHDNRLINFDKIPNSGSTWFHRLNFWGDAQHLCPHGTVCGEQVVRLGATDLWMPSDEPHPEGLPEIQRRAGWPPNAEPHMRIFHYGMLRKEQAMIDKCRIVGAAFFGVVDERLLKAERDGTPWINEFGFDRPLIGYGDQHPPVAHAWLKERGYNVS